MANQQQAAPESGRRGQDGSRWYNERPSGEDIAAWFRENVPIADGLDHKNYVTGITLIPGVEKSKEVIGWRDNGTPIIEERQALAYTPYPRVDIRVKYFHDLMAANPEWMGFIEPVPVETPRGVNLPPGFFPFRVKENNGETAFICCTMKVTVFKRDTVELHTRTLRDGSLQVTRTGEVVIDGPPATKMIGVKRQYADAFSLMKAETGAVGRALGMAGMLVVPGAGVATAEDMGEVADVEARPPQAAPQEGAEAPPAEGKAPTDDELRTEAASIIEEMKLHFPEALDEFRDWAKAKGFGKLSEITSPALKGVVRQLERKLDEVRQGSGNAPATEAEAE